ncbi:PIN-like domain-containing protein [Undibacterium sp. SXout7W]|uniref:PIN-like domain-containing protein n=1 Tax=Undibacterium sp. SXout7W TaxID=3413049 RepID=UPI003BF22E3E
MKKSFAGFYAPSEAEFQKLWEEGTIIFDANVLLDLYRYPKTAREEFIAALEKLKDRFWIPHHVALEFQRNRLSVISNEKKSTEDAYKYASTLISDVQKKIDSLQIDKRGLNISAEELIESLHKANTKFIDAAKAAHDQQLDISSSDPIREKIDFLFAEKVGSCPANQEALDKLMHGGDERYALKIPPGYKDEGKGKNPNEATFIFNKLKYGRKFGDLIFWRQLINYAKENKVKGVMLITADNKEDWWHNEFGRTIGPHPELTHEIMSEANVEIFWMYSPSNFIRHASNRIDAKVSDASVKEIEDVSLSAVENLSNIPNATISRQDLAKFQDEFNAWLQTNEKIAPKRKIIRSWFANNDVFNNNWSMTRDKNRHFKTLMFLKTIFGTVTFNEEPFPKFASLNESPPLGIEVISKKDLFELSYDDDMHSEIDIKRKLFWGDKLSIVFLVEKNNATYHDVSFHLFIKDEINSIANKYDYSSVVVAIEHNDKIELIART